MKKILFSLLLLSIISFFGQQAFAQVTAQTMQQIQSLLQEKNSRTPAQRKIDSRLLQAVREKRGEQMAPGVSLDPVNVNADSHGTLNVDISADITNTFLSKITALGGKIIYASVEYHTVRATINLSTVETIAGYPEVKFIEPAVEARVVDAGAYPLQHAGSYEERVANVRAQLTAYLEKLSPLIGKVTSQGDATHRAASVRSTFGYMGQGIKIGVLSDSYNATGGASKDVTSGDLPGTGNPNGDLTPVTVVQDFSGGSDEGRAMLQVIYDLAPKAQLFFATADVSEASFASNIKTLQTTYHCNIILDDVGYFDEPAFQDGIAAQAVDFVTAAGALYFSSAGNSGALAKGTSGVFEGDFNSTGSPAFTFPGGSKAGTIHNFGTVSSPVNGDIITSAGEVYNLNWSDPEGASGNDYDLFLLSKTGTVKSSSTNIQSGTQNPYEQISAGSLASGDRLVVFKTNAAGVRAFHLNTNRGTLTVVTNGQTTGHACAANAFCMAATPAATQFEPGYPTGPYPNPFVSTNKVEPFSSDGPRRIFYNPDGTAITPGNVIFGTNGGTSLNKPDLTAADGVSTTFASSTGLNPFYGTSCAAPHAGAIAALILSANPSLTAAQVRTILTSTALDIEGAGYDVNSGFGIIQAFQAAQQVNGTTCGVPGGLTTTNLTSSSATISWTAVSGATNYDADYKIHTSSTWTNAATGTAAITLNLSSLSSSTLYDWRVRDHCSSGISAYDTAQFTTAAPPCGVPSGLTSTNITATGATISWLVVGGATSYDADYKIHSSPTWTNAASGTSAITVNLSSLSSSTLYDWRVRDHCPSGTSAYDTAQFTTAAGPCGIPTGLTSTNITSTGATVSWSAVSGANNYDVDYKIDAASTWTNAATATTLLSVNLSSLSSSTLYDWRVRTNCASGSSVYDTANFTTSAAESCNATYDGTVHNSFATAIPIPFNTNVNGTISSATDVDYYTFNISKKGTISITLSTLPADYDLYLYNKNQTQTGASKNRGTVSEAITNKSVGLGTFYVKVMGFKKAFNTSTCYTLNVAPGTATLESPSSITGNISSFNIFPNPAWSVLNVNASTVAPGAMIKVIDTYGKLILVQPEASANAQVNVSTMSSGMYLLMIVNTDGTVAYKSKFVKQ